MTKKSISVASAMLIASSLPLAQAAIKISDTVSIADLSRETLAKQTLKQVQASAAKMAEDADQLRMIGGLKSSPDSHLAKLTALKSEVNRMGREIDSLAAERQSLSPWEEAAVDTVLPLLQATAANTERAIEYYRETRGRLWTEAYRDCAGRVWQDSAQIAKVLKDYLKYDKLRIQEIRVEERIWADSPHSAE